jgi:ATP synthase protein I
MNPPGSFPKPIQQPSQAGARAGFRDADWNEEPPLPRRWSAQEAEALRHQRNAPSPWRVVLVQVEAGAVIALLLGFLMGLQAGLSALYGAATVAIPATLMARGATRMANSRSPMLTAMNLLGWTSVKMVCSLAMLAAAARILHPVVWPALLVALAGCLTVYWAALAWGSTSKAR